MTECRASTTIRSLLLAALAATGLFLAQVSSAATITVTGTGDAVFVDGSVSLREAIASINGGANVNSDVVAVGLRHQRHDQLRHLRRGLPRSCSSACP